MSLATRTILATLSLERLRTLARDFDAEHLWPMSKAAALENLEKCPGVTVPSLLDMLLFDELAKVCKVLGLEAKAHRREVLVARILETENAGNAAPADPASKAAGPPPALAPPPSSRPARRRHRAGPPAAPPAPPP